MTSTGHPSSPERTARRRTALAARVAAADLDALLVTDLTDIRYLTGFTGSNAALYVPVGGPATLCTDSRYALQAREQAPELDIRIERRCPEALVEDAGAQRIGIDDHTVTLVQFHAFADVTHGATELRPGPSLITDVRQVKDAAEIEAIRAACHIGDEALAGLINARELRPGRSEREVALDLDERMRRLGSGDVSFPTILAAGENSAVPHHEPTARPLRRGDVVKIDFGAVVDGYHSDMTRTVVLGPPADWQSELHRLVLAAQTAGRAAIGTGVAASDIDAAARDVISAAGYGDEFGHGLGHGVGLEVHEAPWFGPTTAGTMATDMTVTVEPGVYLPGVGGVRIEDCGVIGRNGYEPFTLTSRDLVVV